MRLSVVICSHNPKKDILTKVIESLKVQTLEINDWELILIDNYSVAKIESWLNLSWHPKAEIIVEEKLGLSYARLCGVQHSTSDLIVFVDDDNMLNPNYLAGALRFHQQHPQVGCFGGKSIPQFETQPPDWFFETGISLGCRDLGDDIKISNYISTNFQINNYPKFSPIGTGMVIQKKAFFSYLEEVKNSTERLALGRRGNALTSGEDNDIVLTIIKKGYEVAYTPSLIITHFIPKARLKMSYLSKMAFEINRSWVKVLALHNINPWKKIPSWTLPIRQFRAYIKIRPWKCELNMIRYQAAYGKFKGQSEI